MKKKKKAKFKCVRCKFKWQDDPKPVKCPECNNKYVLWENFGIASIVILYAIEHFVETVSKVIQWS